MYTQTTGVIVGALSFGNPYDGHTLEEAPEHKGKSPERVYADRGYKGRTMIGRYPDTHSPLVFKEPAPP
jgi:hypothetical protein